MEIKVEIRILDSRITVVDSNVNGVAGIRIILGGRDLQALEYLGGGNLALEDHNRVLFSTTSK